MPPPPTPSNSYYKTLPSSGREVYEFLPSAVNISTCLVSLNVYDLGSGPSSPWALRELRNKENTGSPQLQDTRVKLQNTEETWGREGSGVMGGGEDPFTEGEDNSISWGW